MPTPHLPDLVHKWGDLRSFHQHAVEHHHSLKGHGLRRVQAMTWANNSVHNFCTSTSSFSAKERQQYLSGQLVVDSALRIHN
eukprot:6651937-Karenia_brevis.AAC.1